MVYMFLDRQVFKKISMDMNVHEKGKMDIESSFSFGIHLSEDHSSCIAKLYQDAKLKNDPSSFNISVEVVGEFSCEGISTEEDEKEAHIQAYLMLFPYVQNMIAKLTVDAGLPPLMIQMSKLNPDNIKIETLNE